MPEYVAEASVNGDVGWVRIDGIGDDVGRVCAITDVATLLVLFLAS